MTSPPSALPRSGGPPQTNPRPVPALFQREATLVDAVDHLLNRGAVLVGEATISLAGVELIYVGLNLLVSSVETLREAAPGVASPGVASPPRPLSSGVPSGPGEGEDNERDGTWTAPVPSPSAEGEGQGEGLPGPSPLSIGDGEGSGMRPRGAGEAASPATEDSHPEQGLARLVLTLVELLRQTLERQAVRRMEGGGLSDEEVERMGVALLELEQKMAELREIFGLDEAELNIDLGPLGRLL